MCTCGTARRNLVTRWPSLITARSTRTSTALTLSGKAIKCSQFRANLPSFSFGTLIILRSRFSSGRVIRAMLNKYSGTLLTPISRLAHRKISCEFGPPRVKSRSNCCIRPKVQSLRLNGARGEEEVPTTNKHQLLLVNNSLPRQTCWQLGVLMVKS